MLRIPHILRDSLSHLLGDVCVEGEHPEAEDQLVLALEVDARAEHGQQRADAVHAQERLPVLVVAQQQLQAPRDRRDVLVVLPERGRVPRSREGRLATDRDRADRKGCYRAVTRCC